MPGVVIPTPSVSSLSVRCRAWFSANALVFALVWFFLFFMPVAAPLAVDPSLLTRRGHDPREGLSVCGRLAFMGWSYIYAHQSTLNQWGHDHCGDLGYEPDQWAGWGSAELEWAKEQGL